MGHYFMKLVFLLLLTTTHLYASSDKFPGVFENSFCRGELKKISDKKYNSYFAEAIRKGATKPSEIMEYIERRKRANYLARQSSQAEKEYVVSLKALNKTSRLISEASSSDFVGYEDQNKVRREIIKEFQRAWRNISTQDQQFNPIIIELYNAKPPASVADVKAISTIIAIRTEMVIRRAMISKSFLNLSMHCKLNELPQLTLLAPFVLTEQVFTVHLPMRESYEFIKDSVMDVVSEDNAFAYLPITRDKLRLETANNILMTPQIPSSIKGEISMELDFNKKLQINYSSVVFSAFIDSVAKYFNIFSPYPGAN